MEVGSLVTPLGKTRFFWFGSGVEGVMIISGIHGNEHNSVLAVRKLVARLRKIPESKFNSRVVLVPIANPNAFRFRSRVSVVDGLDLNRVFPGDSEGFATERHAAALWGIARTVDYIIDVHTCGFCEDYILTLYKEYPSVVSLVDSISITNVVESADVRGQLFVEALRENIKAVIIELPQEYFRVDPAVVRRSTKMLFRALISIGAIEGVTNGDINHEFLGVITRHHSDDFGLYVPRIKLGAHVKKGDFLGLVGKSPIKARISGKLISQTPMSFVKVGDTVAGVASQG